MIEKIYRTCIILPFAKSHFKLKKSLKNPTIFIRAFGFRKSKKFEK